MVLRSRKQRRDEHAGRGESEDAAAKKEHRTARVAAVGAVAAAVLGAIVAGVFASLGGGDSTPQGNTSVSADGGRSHNGPACVSGGVVVQGTVNCPPPKPAVPLPEPETADAGCGTFGGRPGQPAFRMKVVMWCAPKAVRGQYQYKLKLTVKNTGRKPLDIRRERFVLLWRSLSPKRWSPPAGGAPERPRQVTYGGRDYWAVFANLDGKAETISPAKGPTFATHWGHTALAPGKSSLRVKHGYEKFSYEDQDGTVKAIRYNLHEDDLVFYVPARAVNRDKNFLGLGYLDGRRIIAVCPQKRWGPRVPPNIF